MGHTYIHKQFATLISSNDYLSNHSSILLSISGGQDSLSLLKLILDIKVYYSWKIDVIYFDHRWREDSYLNLQQILNICRITQLKSYIYEHISHSKNELQCRKWRYKILFYIASLYDYSGIFTAHTFTDLSETFLLHVFRGSSTDGIASIGIKTKIYTTVSLVRPLLNTSRLETAWLSRKFCLPLWSDYTNYKCKNVRNRLRQELIPYLQQHFQPRIYGKIYSFLQNTKQDTEYLQKAAIKLYFLVKHPYFVAMNYNILLSQPQALQYRVIKLFFKHNFNVAITQQAINQVIFSYTLHMEFNFVDILGFRLVFTDLWLYVLVR